MVREFIEGWDLLQVLGEGTFAEVKLLVNRETGEACAMKEINIKENQQAVKAAQKEICVHKLLKHHNIVQCYGSRIEAGAQFIFLEYLSGGELFDRIGKVLQFLLSKCCLIINLPFQVSNFEERIFYISMICMIANFDFFDKIMLKVRQQYKQH